MNTQLDGEADDPGQSRQKLTDRPALDEAHIRLQSEGRSLVIDTGESPDADDLDVHPDHEEKADSSAPAMEVDPPTPQGEEQKIRGFSDKSRRRLRKELHSIRRDAEGVFLTLTYQHTKPTPQKCKRQFDAFWKRLRRWLDEPGVGRISCVWKLEPQKDGTPHIHAIVYGIDFIPAQKVSRLWHQVTDEQDWRHRKSGVDVERAVNEDGKLQSYLAKYMAECYDEWPTPNGCPFTGRWWGVRGRDHAPRASWDEAAVYLDQHEAQFLIRELLDEWDVDLPDGVIPPSLHICTRGDPADRLDELLTRI